MVSEDPARWLQAMPEGAAQLGFDSQRRRCGQGLGNGPLTCGLWFLETGGQSESPFGAGSTWSSLPMEIGRQASR